MSSLNLEGFRNAVLQELAEAANSALAGLPSGSGTNGFAVDAQDGMRRLINEGKDELTKRALPVVCLGTRSLTSGDGCSFALAGFTMTNSALPVKAMRTAESVIFTPSNTGIARHLVRMSPEAFASFYYDRDTADTAAPKYWAYARNDPRTVELHRRTNAAGVLTVQGYGIPADMTGESDVFAWLNTDDEMAIILYAAVKLTQKASDDPRLAVMRSVLLPRLDAAMLAIRNRVSPVVQRNYLDEYFPFSGAVASGG